MTWGQIKKAIEEAGVNEDEEISEITCENENGDHTFHRTRIGSKLKLSENLDEMNARRNAEGCAV